MVLSTLSMFCDLLTSSGNAARNFGFVANQITLLRDSPVQQSKCLALLSITWALGSKNAPRGFRQVLQKLLGSPEERFQQSFTLSSTKIQRGRFARFTGALSGPDCTVGCRRAPIGAGLSRAASTVPSWHGPVLLDPKIRR